VYTHVYLDDNPTATPSDQYEITVTVTDDDTGEDTASAMQTVNNADPEVEVASLDPVAVDEVFTLSGSLSDLGIHAAHPNYPPETHTIEIDWGDGSDPTTIPSADYTADPAFSATHTYTDIGDNTVQYFTIQVTVTDDDTGVGTALDEAGGQGIPIAVYTDPDVDTDSNNDGAIDPDDTPAGSDDPIEADADKYGRLIPLNDDDDNGNDVADLDENPNLAENDLAEIKLDILAQSVPAFEEVLAVLALTSGGDEIRIWDSGTKSTEIPLDASWNLAEEPAPTSLWVEGVTSGAAILELQLRHGTTVLSSDAIRITVFGVDLDIDSLNDNGLEVPADDPSEDAIEADAGHSGKYIAVNHEDRG
jgi:hypothetical protein